MKFRTGNWVKVTRRRMDGPDVQFIGKVVDVTPDYVTAECRTPAGPMRFTASDDTFAIISIQKMTQADWAARKRRAGALSGW